MEIESILKNTAELNRSTDGVEWLSVPSWSKQDWLWHGFSTRRGGLSRVYRAEGADSDMGELNLGFTEADSRENVLENRSRFAYAVTGSREIQLQTLRQIHSNCSVTADGASVSAPEADGIMTDQPGLLLGVQTADCIPVLVADPVRRAVAGFHAGWRGTVERVVELGIGRMVREFGCDPATMIAAIGPGIGNCCYAVGGEVQGRFTGNFPYAGELFALRSGNLYLDLIEANRRQLVDVGLKPDSISVVDGCTSCQPELFFSHRASGGHAGRMMAAIGIR